MSAVQATTHEFMRPAPEVGHVGDRCMVVLSGGQDSTTCLFWAKQHFREVHALTVDYGQKHRREIESAMQVAEMAGVASHEIVEVPKVLAGRSPLTNPDETLETYSSFEEMDSIIGNRIELTFVPMRNPFFLTLAANRALSLGISDLVTGVCMMDNANYPDCRPDFIAAFEDMTRQAMGTTDFRIHTPLMYLSKAQSAVLAFETPGAFEALAYSHTAYSGEYPPKTQDHATVLRAAGFREAGLPDPLIARAWVAGDLDELPSSENYDGLRKGQGTGHGGLDNLLHLSVAQEAH